MSIVRRLIPLIAALALLAPSCPRDYGPSDYDPEAVRPFPAYNSAEDLVYVGGGSAKGDSVYAMTMPSGKVLARIDGPDPRGWLFAPDDVAYYAVTRYTDPTTVRRLHLRTGMSEEVVSDPRAPGQTYDVTDSIRTPLALSSDGKYLFVARLLKDGPQAWVGRYDLSTGRLQRERSWGIAAEAGGVRFAGVGEAFALIAFGISGGRAIDPQLHVLDAELRDVSSLGKADGLADDEACSARIQRATNERWATVCSWERSRYATILWFDAALRVASHTVVPIEPQENIRAWAAGNGVVSIVTDRARFLRVGIDGTVALSSLTHDPTSRMRTARELGPGLLAAHWMVNAETSPSPEMVVIDVLRGEVIARSAPPPFVGLNIAGDGELHYAVTYSEAGAQVWRIDLRRLTLVGHAVLLPRRDDVTPGALIAVVPGKK
jgi:hypothetical protein